MAEAGSLDWPDSENPENSPHKASEDSAYHARQRVPFTSLGVLNIHPQSTVNLKLAWKQSRKPSVALDRDILTNRPNQKTS